MLAKQIAFAVVVILAHVLFFANLTKFVKIALRGRPAKLEETLGQRLGSLMAFFFGQRKVMEERSSWHHLAIYWGFLVITIATADMLMSGLGGEWFNLGLFLGGTIYAGIKAAVDVANLIVMAAILYALFRRLVIKPRFIPVNLDAMLILGAILTLVVTHYLHHAFHMAHAGKVEAGAVVSIWWGRLLGLYTPGAGDALTVHVDQGAAFYASEANWWAHMLVILSFLNYLPFSKHVHVLGSGPNIFFRKQGQKGAMPKLELFEDFDMEKDAKMENWGVGRIEDFDWKSLIDNYSCTECARCTTYCPAFATEKPLSPMHLIHDLKDEMKARGPLLLELDRLGGKLAQPGQDESEVKDEGPNKDKIAEIKKMLAGLPPLVGGRIKDETLWSCTTCGACQEVCPVFIDHPLKILQMRTWIVLNDESGRTPSEATKVMNNIANGQGNPWNMPARDRMKWAQGLSVPTLEDNPEAEWLFFVGCAGAYDDTAKKTTRALVKILEAAGVSYAVMGNDEKCTGDTVRRLGGEMDFQLMAQDQVNTLNELGVKKIITSCPHCFHVIKNEYPQFGGRYETVHHTQLITRLIADGRLKVENALDKRVTYHDSCYLGRWNDVYDAPRDAIERAVGGKGSFVELDRNKQHGFCCGAGGGRMWIDEEPEKRVNFNRAKEIVEAKVDTVAVGCPFCKTMLSDGMKHYGKDEEIEVMDIAQLVAATLPDPSPASPTPSEGASA